MVDLSRLMQDAATLEVIEKSAIEAQVLRHDIEAYRGCLGYSVSGDHNGRLSDGTLPNNGIADALDNECRTLSAQNSAQAMQIDELKRDLAAANARAEQNEKDAERYRWWRDNFGIVHDGPGTWQLYTIVYTNKVMTSPLFDAAIDAAIDAKENP